ncbi:MAG: thiamine pyrophosphate-dependent dehydrogenase E1 component subunit alpha [Candidatus Limnocylindrales bacterium]
MLAPLAPAELVAQFQTMVRIRRFEEALILLAADHDIGHFHVYIGQEATGVPALALLKTGDVSYTTHRNHGHLIARGVDPARMLAEILGKATGTNGGYGGTLHLASAEHGFPTTSSSVGGPLPIAAGSAFAFQVLGLDQVSVSLFGDGALEEGVWHETVNIAAMRHLPLIFLCENNSLEALGQKANEYPSSTLAAVELTDLVVPFGVPVTVVDGTDSGAVHGAMTTALERARGGGGPTFIEARTVRWPGNRPLWPQLLTGRTVLEMAWDEELIGDEHRAWHSHQDGLLRYARELLAAGLIDSAGIQAIDARALAEMDAAREFALSSPYPEPEQALDHVFG